MATLMGMMGGGGPAAAPQQGGMGFGIGQQMMQGAPGATQYAQGAGAQPSMLDQLQTMFPQGGPGTTAGAVPGQGIDMQKLAPLIGMMMQQNHPQQQMAPMMGMGAMRGPQQGQTQASRGYLAQGGGLTPRNVVNQGY